MKEENKKFNMEELGRMKDKNEKLQKEHLREKRKQWEKKKKRIEELEQDKEWQKFKERLEKEENKKPDLESVGPISINFEEEIYNFDKLERDCSFKPNPFSIKSSISNGGWNSLTNSLIVTDKFPNGATLEKFLLGKWDSLKPKKIDKVPEIFSSKKLSDQILLTYIIKRAKKGDDECLERLIFSLLYPIYYKEYEEKKFNRIKRGLKKEVINIFHMACYYIITGEHPLLYIPEKGCYFLSYTNEENQKNILREMIESGSLEEDPVVYYFFPDFKLPDEDARIYHPNTKRSLAQHVKYYTPKLISDYQKKVKDYIAANDKVDSIDKPIVNGEGKGTPREEFIPNPEDDIEEDVLRRETKINKKDPEEVRRRLEKIKDEFGSKKRAVWRIKKMHPSLTQEEIAKKLKEREINISQQTISRYLNKEKIIPKIDQFVKKLDTKEKQVK
jgi:hypothetical protein